MSLIKLLFAFILALPFNCHALKVAAGTYEMCTGVGQIEGRPMVVLNFMTRQHIQINLKGSLADNLVAQGKLGVYRLKFEVLTSVSGSRSLEATLLKVQSCEKADVVLKFAGNNLKAL